MKTSANITETGAQLLRMKTRMEAVHLLFDEMERAILKHPKSQPGMRDALRSAAIVAEEAGEALQAALDLTRPDSTDAAILQDLHRLRQELIETGAMALLFLINWKFTEDQYLE